MPYAKICINTSDRSTPLFVLLNSLMIQTVMAFDVIVIDDGSRRGMTDEDVVYFKDKFGLSGVGFEYIKNPQRLGLSKSRNLGLDSMDKSFIGIFLDDDHICDSRFVEQLLLVFDRRKMVGCVGALFPHIEGSIRYESCPPPIFGNILHDKNWGDHQRFYYPFFSNEDGIYPAKVLGGIVAFRVDPRIRKEERLSFVSHTEDTLFALRYLEHGYENYVNIRALAYHRMIGDGGCRTFANADEMRSADAIIFKEIFNGMLPFLKGDIPWPAK